MNKTDKITLQFANAVYQTSMKKLDDLLCYYERQTTVDTVSTTDGFANVASEDYREAMGYLANVATAIQTAFDLAISEDSIAVAMAETEVNKPTKDGRVRSS